MAIRITQNQLAAQFNNDLQSIYSKLAKSQQQVSDGRRITKPSDDPYGTGQVLGFDRQLVDVRRYQENASDALGMLNSADSALDSVSSALTTIREKGLQAQNGTNAPQDLVNLANEIEQLGEVVRDGMNAKHGDSYIFGGTANVAPYGTNTYGGSTGTINKLIGDGQSVSVNLPGSTVLGPDGTNTLDTIAQLVFDLRNGNPIGAGMAAIEGHLDTAITARTQLGATVSRVETTIDRLEQTEERLLAARTEVADVDAGEAFLEYSQQQTMYQAALAAGTRIMQTSILDFI